MTNPSLTRPARIVLLLENLTFGGTQRQTLELARGLNRRRFQPEIWTLAAGDDLEPLAREWGIPVVRFSHHRKPGPVDLIRVWLRLRRNPPDLLMTLTALPNIWGRILGRCSRLPLLVGNVRGLNHRDQHERWLWPLAGHIICNANKLKNILNSACKIPLDRITVIPNGVDTDFFQPEGPAAGRKPVILCVARLAPVKDHATLIRAFGLVLRDHPEAELWLVGDGPLEQTLRESVKQTLPPGRVRFLPGRPDVRPLLEEAALLVLSSRQEAFPNVILEAMAMGLPVAATEVGGIPEMVFHGETGWLAPPGNPPALAAAMSQLLGDPETRLAFGRAARQRVERHFSLATMVRGHEEVFEKLLAQRASGRGFHPQKKPTPAFKDAVSPAVSPAGTSLSPVSAPDTASPRVAYLLLWFPEPSQTFILDEVNTLCRLGLEVKVYTLYGPRPSQRLAGMAPALAPVERLGIASLGTLVLDLLRLLRDRRPLARRVLAETLVRKWRRLETAGEALWATLAGLHLGKRLQAAGFQHLHAPWADGPATAAWVASRLSGIPFSCAAHARDIYPPDGALREKLAAASFIRAISRINRDFLAACEPAAADKIAVIHLGAPLKLRPGPRRPPRAPYQLLSIGRMVPKKGFPILLEACRELAARGVDFHLILAGDGSQRRELVELAQGYGLSGRVHFPGFVPHGQVPRLFLRADLFIMPSIIAPSGDRDGIPTVIMEALAHEVPVVSTCVSGIPEIVLPGKTGWLAPPGDAKALAGAVMEALSDPEEARRRGRAGKELVAREFDSEKNYGRLKELLEKHSRKRD
ncbi:MAG: glycosyltransferase [Deltaproteobacteria bacterium]|nr:MAG: glycosyltransferase [Deltaproteobacteria bacterium]